MIDVFVEMSRKMGRVVTVKSEDDVEQDDMRDIDIVVSLGGDHTFLRSAALIWDSAVPILGINTYSAMYTGALNTCSINYHNRFKEAENILEAMEDEHWVDFEKRTRIHYERVRTRDD